MDPEPEVWIEARQWIWNICNKIEHVILYFVIVSGKIVRDIEVRQCTEFYLSDVNSQNCNDRHKD